MPETARRLIVAVVGAGDASPAEERLADEVGRGLARGGAAIVCGGLGGVMAAACRGARGAGGMTIGLLPGTDAAAGNAWLDVALPTGLGEGRNVLVVRASSAVVAIGGEYGTLSEIALALKTGTPVVGLGTWQLAKGGVARTDIVEALDPDEAVAAALRLASRPGGA